tara:strand:+ start:7163 stop:7726 length:564 start_codon:yes stop_codon:yes gene_type:complete
MRVIAGIFKGKKIIIPPDKTTRPLKDITKESIFNIINHSNKFSMKIQDAVILDLFSGVGSFGIECISRGAKYVSFVENYSKVIPILKQNLKSLKINNVYEILEKDIIKELNFQKFHNSFDIIFLDPPFKDKFLPKILEIILKNKILTKNGIIILHRNKKEKEILPSDFRILEKREYGLSKIIFGNQK